MTWNLDTSVMTSALVPLSETISLVPVLSVVVGVCLPVAKRKATQSHNLSKIYCTVCTVF